MARLNHILGSVMRDIILAQHEANLYSCALSEQYGKYGKTKDFPLPGVNISDVEMTLRYGVLDMVGNYEQSYVAYKKFNKFMKELCETVAQKTIANMKQYIMSHSLQTDKGQEFFDKIKEKGEVYQQYLRFIVKKLCASYKGSIHELIDDRTGIPDEAEIVKRLKDAVSQHIINDRDNMSKLFNDTDGKNTKVLEDRIAAEIEKTVKKNCQKKNFKKKKEFPNFNVAVTVEELKNLPSDAIHTCKLKFTPTSLNIQADNEDGLSASVNIEDIIK